MLIYGWFLLVKGAYAFIIAGVIYMGIGSRLLSLEDE